MLPQLFRAEIPLPNNPLKATNSYIIKDKKRNLIIDTGLNLEECHAVMITILNELKIDMRQTDFYITHFHIDHLGLVGKLAMESSCIYFNERDARIINSKNMRESLYQKAKRHGFPEIELKEAFVKHPANHYSSIDLQNFKLVKDGDRLDYGPYKFTCVHTPGHTPGHMCLYEPSRKLFISGDHILGDISPNISAWDDKENPLNDYLKSLDKVYLMEIELTLPAHGRIISDCRSRISNLKMHHEKRLQEVASIIKKTGLSSAYEIAAQMKWDVDTRRWASLAPIQKWFAVGEAVAHIRYLEEIGMA